MCINIFQGHALTFDVTKSPRKISSCLCHRLLLKHFQVSICEVQNQPVLCHFPWKKWQFFCHKLAIKIPIIGLFNMCVWGECQWSGLDMNISWSPYSPQLKLLLIVNDAGRGGDCRLANTALSDRPLLHRAASSEGSSLFSPPGDYCFGFFSF